MEITLVGDVTIRAKTAVSAERHELTGAHARLLFAMLVWAGDRGVTREALADALWPDRLPSTWPAALRGVVSRVRGFVAKASPPGGDVLIAHAGRYVLRLPADARIDVVVAERNVEAAEAAMAGGGSDGPLGRAPGAEGATGPPRGFGPRPPRRSDPQQARRLASEAVARLRAPFLAESQADWAVERRDHLAELLVTALEQVSRAATEMGDTTAAVLAAKEAVALAPLREHGHRCLMAAHAGAGNRGEALQTYERLRRLLAEEMGVDPSPETELAYLDLLGAPDSSSAPPPEPHQPDRPHPPRHRHNLPHQLTSFVGRVDERRAVAAALADSRLVTLCGSGGCGKTRLALAVADDVLDRFPDGAWFVDLSALSDPALVPSAVAAVLDDELDPCRRPEALVLVDNCEHVIDAAAEAVEALLVRFPSVRVLATSREELQVGPERVCRVGALGLPAGTLDEDRGAVVRSDAVQLFLERGRSSLDGFAPSGPAVDVVAEICRRLDGIPLAIELAAALVGSLPLREICDRLDDRFRLLTPSPRRAPQRQRTLRAALEWSFDLLDDTEREVFMRLGAFVGDFTLAAAEAVAGPEPSGGDADPQAVVRSLRRLVATSMVTCVAGCDGAERYRLIETIRHYAREHLDRRGLTAEVARRHALHYVAVAAEAERNVHGAGASQWLAQVVAELPNLRAAVAWAFSSGDLDAGLRLAGSLRWFFARMGQLEEAAGWLERGLARGQDLPADLRLMALTAASGVAFASGDFSSAAGTGDEAVAIARRQGDPLQLAIALINRGAAAVYQGDLRLADELLAEGDALCTEHGDQWGKGWALTLWAVGSRRAGQAERARRQGEEALALFRGLGDEHGQVLPLIGLGLTAQDAGRYDEAVVAAREATRLAVIVADRQLQHTAMCLLGRIEQDRRRLGRARELLIRSVRDVPRAHHNQIVVAIALEGLAGLAGDLGDHAAAAVVAGHAERVRERAFIPLSPARRREHDEWVATAERALGRDRLVRELDRGRTTDLAGVLRVAEEATVGIGEPGTSTVDLVTGDVAVTDLAVSAGPGRLRPRGRTT